MVKSHLRNKPKNCPTVVDYLQLMNKQYGQAGNMHFINFPDNSNLKH
jgi:hypothetical protein